MTASRHDQIAGLQRRNRRLAVIRDSTGSVNPDGIPHRDAKASKVLDHAAFSPADMEDHRTAVRHGLDLEMAEPAEGQPACADHDKVIQTPRAVGIENSAIDPVVAAVELLPDSHEAAVWQGRDIGMDQVLACRTAAQRLEGPRRAFRC
jgi:hypothetical protein